MIKIKHLILSEVRYRTKTEEEHVIIKRIEDSLNVIFWHEDDTHRLEEKAISGYCLGLEIRLSIWHDPQIKDELVFMLNGRNRVYDREIEDTEEGMKLDEYIIELFRLSDFNGWYIPSNEEFALDEEFSGGE